jgi:hypothetical protein
MKATTIRFGPDVWEAIAAEAERAGVSTAQYIRDAALARAAAAAGARGEGLFEGPATNGHDPTRLDLLPPGPQQEIPDAPAITRANAMTRANSVETRNGARALRAESQQARRVARDLRSHKSRLKRST